MQIRYSHYAPNFYLAGLDVFQFFTLKLLKEQLKAYQATVKVCTQAPLPPIHLRQAVELTPSQTFAHLFQLLQK